MKLSELRKVIRNMNRYAKLSGNPDPDVSFWFDDLDPELVLKVKQKDATKDSVLESGNIQIRLVKIENPKVR